MASSLVPKQEEGVAVDIDLLANPAESIYQKCSQKAEGTVFFQRDLSNMQVAETMAELTTILQELCDKHLMKLMTVEGEPCWKLRSRIDAESIRGMVPDERILYHFIEQAETEGIWSKELRARTNVTQQSLTKCLKNLASKGLVKTVTSAKFPSRKMYLLSHLEPSEDIVGGPWQTDGEYDQALIDIVCTVTERHIREETCVEVPFDWNDHDGRHKRAAEEEKRRAAAIEAKKAEVRNSNITDIEDGILHRPFDSTCDSRAPTLVYKDSPQYPTARSVAKWLNVSGLLKSKTVKEKDMEEILELMTCEGRIQQRTETDYRTDLAHAKGVRASNGFVDSPCGVCPVFDRCGPSGEITARTCVYFAEWLGTESEEV